MTSIIHDIDFDKLTTAELASLMCRAARALEDNQRRMRDAVKVALYALEEVPVGAKETQLFYAKTARKLARLEVLADADG